MIRIRGTVIAVAVAIGMPLDADGKAMRIVSIGISVDGNHILGGMHGDNGSVPEAAVWRYLSFVPLKPHEGAVIKPDDDDPLKATLKGKIHIEVRYGGQADVEELHLVRTAANAEWTVANDDVERIAKDIGLGTIPPPPPPAPAPAPPPAQSTAAPLWIWITGAAMLLAMLVVLVMLWRTSGAE